MNAIFGRKMPNLKELQAITDSIRKAGHEGLPYLVTREVLLSDSDFQAFAEELLEDQPWIEKGDGGMNSDGEIRCIRVINTLTGERVLVNCEGYDYPRYTAIET